MRLVHKLPALSRFRCAVADDDRLAAGALASGQPIRPSRPTLDDWTVWDELNTTLADGFQLVQLAIAAANSEKGQAPRFRPHPRPKTALQRETARQEWAIHRDIVAQVLPDQD